MENANLTIQVEVIPVPMIMACPSCHARHIDVGEFATKPHHTHACQSCGTCWRPAIVPTVGVQFLPGFKNAEPSTQAATLVPKVESVPPSMTDRVQAGDGAIADTSDTHPLDRFGATEPISPAPDQAGSAVICERRCTERGQTHGPTCAAPGCGACQWDMRHDPFHTGGHMFVWPTAQPEPASSEPTLAGHDEYCDGNHNACPSHCCQRHGCKYGYSCCPVARGIVKQDHPCEECREDEAERRANVDRFEELDAAIRTFEIQASFSVWMDSARSIRAAFDRLRGSAPVPTITSESVLRTVALSPCSQCGHAPHADHCTKSWRVEGYPWGPQSGDPGGLCNCPPPDWQNEPEPSAPDAETCPSKGCPLGNEHRGPCVYPQESAPVAEEASEKAVLTSVSELAQDARAFVAWWRNPRSPDVREGEQDFVSICYSHNPVGERDGEFAKAAAIWFGAAGAARASIRPKIGELRETANDLLRQRNSALRGWVELAELLGCTEDDDSVSGAVRALKAAKEQAGEEITVLNRRMESVRADRGSLIAENVALRTQRERCDLKLREIEKVAATLKQLAVDHSLGFVAGCADRILAIIGEELKTDMRRWAAGKERAEAKVTSMRLDNEEATRLLKAALGQISGE